MTVCAVFVRPHLGDCDLIFSGLMGADLSDERIFCPLVFRLIRRAVSRDFETSFLRSLQLGLIVMVLTVVISLVTGLAFRKKFFGSNLLFYTTVASLIVPSILVSLGIGLIFNIMGWEVSWTTSGLGASHLDTPIWFFDHDRCFQQIR